jgi:hypothetical protein
MSFYCDLSGYLFYKDGVFTRVGKNRLCECDIEGSFYTVNPEPTYNKTTAGNGGIVTQNKEMVSELGGKPK